MVCMHLKINYFKLRVSLETLFKCHMQLESVVLLEYLLCLKYNLWLQTRIFYSSILLFRFRVFGFSDLLLVHLKSTV